MNSRCHICGNHETLFHILNNCKTALTQGRYNYRHDSVVSYLVNVCQILNNVDKVIEVYADIKGHTVNGGTIPQDIVVTSSRPDIVLVDRGNEEVILAELTCPFEPYIDNAHDRKSEKYSSLQSDIEANGLKCRLICFEVGSRGLITKDNKNRLSEILHFVNKKEKMKCHFQNISKMSILASYAIYNARKDPEWLAPPLLKH